MNEINVVTAAGVNMLLRFDLGTARVLKSISNVDIIAGNSSEIDESIIPEKIFLAAYKRGCSLYKKIQELTDVEACEVYYELSTPEALKVMAAFTEAVAPPKKEGEENKTGEVKNG